MRWKPLFIGGLLYASTAFAVDYKTAATRCDLFPLNCDLTSSIMSQQEGTDDPASRFCWQESTNQYVREHLTRVYDALNRNKMSLRNLDLFQQTMRVGLLNDVVHKQKEEILILSTHNDGKKCLPAITAERAAKKMVRDLDSMLDDFNNYMKLLHSPEGKTTASIEVPSTACTRTQQSG